MIPWINLYTLSLGDYIMNTKMILLACEKENELPLVACAWCGQSIRSEDETPYHPSCKAKAEKAEEDYQNGTYSDLYY
jgi:hypothetical protein